MNTTGWLSRLTLLQALTLALLVKLVIAALLPMTGDEAYFVLWGRHLDYGYYDHPPMAGWMTWLMLQFSEHPVVVRLPGIATELLIALGLYAQWQRIDAEKARLAALLFLFSPLSLIFAFTLTDTGCMLFAAASSFAAAQALRHASPATLVARHSAGHSAQSYGWAVLAGLALGLAFLSKYFAVFLGLAYLIYFFAINRRLWRLGLTLVLVAIPFGLLNLYWNLTHCWSNLLFNLVNRNRGEAGIQWSMLSAFRDDYRKNTPSWYRGEMHLAFTLLFTGSVIWYCAAHIDAASWVEWVAVVVPMFLFGNWAEWAGHRWLLHSPKSWLKPAYKRHVNTHHQFFSHKTLDYHGQQDWRALLFPPFAPVLFVVAALPPALLLGTLSLSLATFMNVLDSSIANVSIPAIAGDMGVSPAQGTWVITSFGVANAIALPLTGWLTQRFGQVRLFALCVLLPATQPRLTNTCCAVPLIFKGVIT